MSLFQTIKSQNISDRLSIVLVAVVGGQVRKTISGAVPNSSFVVYCAVSVFIQGRKRCFAGKRN
jgi:hypothetical protein